VKCQISDLAFDECVRSGLQSAIPQLSMGNNTQYDYFNKPQFRYMI